MKSSFEHLLTIEHKYDFDLGRILYFIAERQNILRNKQAGVPQQEWTNDHIFAEYRFCNVDREDDRVTAWLRENIRKPYAEHPDLWLMLALSRWINWPPTIAEMEQSEYWFGKPNFSLQGLADVMLARQNRGEKVYTGSYMIRAESDPSSPFINKTKHEFICLKVVGQLYEDRQSIERILNDPECTLELAHKTIMGYINWGGFMAYELITDLNHTRYLENATDRYTWLNPGPGYVRGANRIMGRPLNSSLSMKAANEYGAQVVEGVHWAYDNGLIPNHLIERSQLDSRMVESAHCESDKYLRVLNGEGRPRAKYQTHSKHYNV